MAKEGRKERKVSTYHPLAHTAALLGAVLLAGLSGSARADSDPLARFDYSVPARFAVPTPAPEGYWEQYIAPGEAMHPATWRVDFEVDVCPPPETIAEYRWYVDDSLVESRSSCAGFSHFLAEGKYAVGLVAVDGEGGEHRYDGQVVVQDWLIFGMGDSYGSGEGNPDVPISLDDIDLAETAEAVWEAATASDAARAYRDVLEALDVTAADVVAVQDELEDFITALEDVANCSPIDCAQAALALEAAIGALEAEVALLELDLDYADLLAIATAYAELDNDARNAIASAWDALEAALAALTPTWQNQSCHRSATSGQVQAAQLLEESDPRSSVTFVHLACSGATISKGLLYQYDGIEPGYRAVAAQVDRAEALVTGEREIEMLVISIGGNDANFGPVLETCMVGEPCHDAPELDPAWDELLSGLCDFEVVGPLIPYCQEYLEGIQVEDASDLFDGGLAGLPAGYAALDAAITELLHVDPGRVFLTEYPDVTRDETGAYCGWSADQELSEQIKHLPGMSQSEFEWADTYAATLLRDTMKSAATTHGWSFVEGIAAPFETHGYCAEDNWLVRLQESFLQQGDQYGAVHPGPDGHGVYANAIVAAVPEPGPTLAAVVALLALGGLAKARPRD